MIEIDRNKLIAKTGNVYKLAILASKRARQLKEGSPKLVETNSEKPSTIALEEIAAGKVGYKEKS